ncbi:MAG: hypothetical protein DMD58_05330 [Gemmatimonadetes bacterium]|nr:MAG: hypothetical protein DMD58_05330 [Gemmatimonadota bacterium]
MKRITDVHIHIQPWRQLKPAVQEAMRKGKEDHWEILISLMDDPRALLEVMDKSGVWRVGLVNYPSPDIMGFDDSTNTFAAKYAQTNPERLLPYGGVHARFTRDPQGDVDRLIDLGIRLLKVHPRSKYGNPLELDDVAIDFPDLQLIMAHGGRPLYMEEAFFILRRHGQVRLDVSGIPPSKLLEYFPRLTEIVDRVLWGTDWPSPGVKDLRQNIDQFLTLPLTNEQQRAILETNALALFPAES